MCIKNTTIYKVLAYIQRIVMPGAVTLLAALGEIWGIPNVEPICMTIAAVDTFLGTLLYASSATYYEGIANSLDSDADDGEDEEGGIG